MSLLRPLPWFLFAGLVAAACSSGIAPTPVSEATGSPSSSSSTSGGHNGYPIWDNDNTSSTSSSSSGLVSTALNPARVTQIVVDTGSCGGPRGICHGAHGYTVTLTNGLFEKRTCVDASDAGGDASPDTSTTKTSRTLTADELMRVKSALGQVRVASRPFTGYDGQIYSLEVIGLDGDAFYSPDAGCNKERFRSIEAGFPALWTLLSGL